MNWPSMEKQRIALVTCGLVVAGCCCIAACNSIPTGEQAQAKPEERTSRETADRAPLTEDDVLAFIESERFQTVGIGLGFGNLADTASDVHDELQVRFAGEDVWVFEGCRESGGARSLLEERLAGAIVSQLNIPNGSCSTSMLPYLHVIDSLSSKVTATLEDRLTDARLCTLALYLAANELESVDDAQGHARQEDMAELEQSLGQDSAQGMGAIEHRCIPLRQGNNGGRLHWVVVNADDLGEVGPADEKTLISAVEERLRVMAEGNGSPADKSTHPNAETDGHSTTDKKDASTAGIAKETRGAEDPSNSPESSAPSSPSNGNANSDGAAQPAGPTSPRPSSPGSVEVVEQPSNGGLQHPDEDASNTTSSPEKPRERTWVVDRAAWDERVLTAPAWDEQVWVEKLEWVPNNVWVVDQAAWDEQVIAQEGYYESVPMTTHYRFFADGYVTYDDDDMLAHLKELLAQDLPTNYCVEWEYEQVWHEPEYSTVHHDETGHWEDHGSYQDKGHYQTVHHEAQYTTVHHDEEGHWE